MIANALTALRLLLIGPVVWGITCPGDLAAGGLLACVLAGIATDFFDGKAARRYGSASPRGQLFDHTTDFLFVTSGIAAAAVVGAVPIALPILIVVAFSQYVLDSYWLHRQKQLRMSSLGRWNGVFYFVPLVVLGVADLAPDASPLHTLLRVVAWVLVATTLVSIVDRGLAARPGGTARFPAEATPDVGPAAEEGES